MKFTFDRDAMIKEVSIAQEIISTKNAGSILSNISISAYNNTLNIKATDIKVNFETQIPVQIEEEGSTTIYCDKFMGILSSLPEGEIEFIQSSGDGSDQAVAVIIKPVGKKIKFQIKSMSQEKFPDFDSAEDVPYFEVPSKEIKEMIGQTAFAVSEDETRYFMNGVYFEKKDDKLNLVATDGRRLSFASKSLLAGVSDFPAAIVHPKILNIISKRSPDEGNISIAVVDKMIFFRFGTYKFGSVLLEGQFPNYARVIPENQAHSFQVQKSDLTNALKRVALMVDKKAGRLYFNISDGILKITSQQSDMGSADEEIPCEYAGQSYVLALNYRYIEEPLRVIDADRIVFEFTEEMKAVTMRPEPAGDYFHIIMPMQKE
ncbi:MAG: DNA polymerase III subunit beta [Treponema sp.]|nr:DNA polymerase III subunit beta [Treponema sp.]